MSRQITIEISDKKYSRLVALVARWNHKPEEIERCVQVELESCFMAGLAEMERQAEIEGWRRAGRAD